MPDDYNECLRNFSEDLPSFLIDRYRYIVSAKVKIQDAPTDIKFETNLIPLEYFNFIKVEVNFKYPKEDIKLVDENLYNEHFDLIAVSLVSDSIEDALCLTQLAYPARFHFQPAKIIAKNALDSSEKIGGLLFDTLIPLPWPKIGTLSFSQVAEWERQVGLFQSGIAKTPIQRSLASFTHAACNPHGGTEEQLFWAMQGLESFYCRGNGELRKQLADKCRIFLGEWDVSKNIAGQMYDMRSKFVHGSFNLPRWGNNFDFNDADRKEQYDLFDAFKLAIHILIATLQKCVTENFSSIEFNYQLQTEKF